MESYGNKQQSLRQTIHTKQILSYTQLAFSNLNCSTIKNHTIKTQLPSHNSFTVPYISVSFPYFPYPNPSTIIKISEKPHTFHLFHLKIQQCSINPQLSSHFHQTQPRQVEYKKKKTLFSPLNPHPILTSKDLLFL